MSEVVAIEQREHPRLAPAIIRTEVEHDGARRLGYLMNVSLGGAFLVVDDPPMPESKVTFWVLLPWGMGECRLEARAVWSQTDEDNRPIGAGVAFVDLSGDSRRKLKNYLDRFVELAAEITR